MGVGIFRYWVVIGCIGLLYVIVFWFNEEIFCLFSVLVVVWWYYGIDNIYIIFVVGYVDNFEDGIKYKKIYFYVYRYIGR